MSATQWTIPEELAARARALKLPPQDEGRHLLRPESAQEVDALLVRVTRGRGSLDVAIGRGLEALSLGIRLMQLGFSNVGDYAAQRLGMSKSAAKGARRLARELRWRPLLARAVRSGEVSARKAQEILPVAIGEQEERWVEYARVSTVRELQRAVAAARRGLTPEPEERFERIWMELGQTEREVLEVALSLADKVIGPGSLRWEQFEAILQEYLAAGTVEALPHEDAEVMHRELSGWLAAAKEGLEVETRRWEALEAIANVASPEVEFSSDPFRIDEQLRELAAMRTGWDETFGHLAFLVKRLGLWRELGFANFAHYCEERLGVARRTADERVALERKLYSLVPLRPALSEGRVSYEQARVIARCADEKSVDEWIARAEELTCVQLARSAEDALDRQMCGRNELELIVPKQVTGLLSQGCRAVRSKFGLFVKPADCLSIMAAHFIKVWKHVVKGRSTPQSRVLERDKGRCQVPVCSRRACHVHHIKFRSQGGGDEEENLISLCAYHHLVGIHEGYIWLSGKAPGELRWEIGLRPWMAPLMVVTSQGIRREEVALEAA